MNMMSKQGPSPYQIKEALDIAHNVRAALIAADPGLEGDDDLLADILDGETDALDVVRRIIRVSLEADALADTAEARAKALNERRDRFQRRSEALRATALQMMELLHVYKLMDASFTASVGAGCRSVVITGEVPDQFMRVRREPDKTAIKAAIEAGTEVAGAVMSNGSTVLTVRTR